MTDKQAAAIAARAEAATSGSWKISTEDVAWDPAVPEPGVTRVPIYYQIVRKHPESGSLEIVGPFGYEGGGVFSRADAAFIAHAREDIPALLAERAALRELLGSVVAYVPRTVPDPEIVNIQAHARALLAGDDEHGEESQP